MVTLSAAHLSGVGVFKEGEEEVLLVLEVRVDGPLGEAGRRRHLVEGGAMEAPLGEDLSGGLEQVVAGLLAPAFSGERFEWPWACATSEYSYILTV